MKKLVFLTALIVLIALFAACGDTVVTTLKMTTEAPASTTDEITTTPGATTTSSGTPTSTGETPVSSSEAPTSTSNAPTTTKTPATQNQPTDDDGFGPLVPLEPKT